MNTLEIAERRVYASTQRRAANVYPILIFVLNYYLILKFAITSIIVPLSYNDFRLVRFRLRVDSSTGVNWKISP